MPEHKQLVGTEQATEWLATNKRNRRLSSNIVEKYTNLMRDKLWQYDGSPIRFDTEGNVIDGQHRLWAVIESGTTQEFLIITGLAPETFLTIDTGKSRTFADLISINYPNTPSLSHVAAATQIVYKWETGLRGKPLSSSGYNKVTSNAVLMQFFANDHDRLIDIARRGHTLSSRVTGLSPSTLSLLLWVLEGIDQEDATFFFDRLIDGTGLAADSPILALRNTLTRFYMSSKGAQRRLPTEHGVALTIKAWNLYRAGDTIKVLSYRAGGANPEAFPIPN
jgi:hypothetical protein